MVAALAHMRHPLDSALGQCQCGLVLTTGVAIQTASTDRDGHSVDRLGLPVGWATDQSI